MTTPCIDGIIEEFEKRFGLFTFNNGGALEFTLWDVVDERVHSTDEVGLVIQDWLRTALTQAHQAGDKGGYERGRQAGINEAVEKIKEAVSTIKVETTPPHRPDETLQWQADLINKHIMPAVRERFLAEIEALQDNK